MPARRTTGQITLRAFCLTAMIASGCASQTARFYTELPQPGSLTAGSPVFNLGSSIGSVASVNRLPDGNAGVAFDVDHPDADAIRRASVMVVHDDPGGASLDVMNADPLSPPASPGAQIDGASNQNDANSLVAAKNLAASAPAMAMMMSAPGGGAAINSSPAWLALQQQILALQTQMLVAGTNGAAAAAQQLAQINQDAAALERQMIAAGNSAEADQLRRQIEALSHTLAMPLPGTTPPSGMPPAVGTASPYGAPPSAAPPPPGPPSASGATPSSGALIIPPAS